MGGGLLFRLINLCFAIHGFAAAESALAAPAAIDKLFKHYQDLKTFEAEFKQEKRLQAEGLTISSTGVLRVALGKALLYEIKAPGRLAVFLDSQVLEIRSGEGAKATRNRYPLKGAELSEKITENLKELTALLAMDRAELDKAYAVSEEQGKLVLTPTAPKQFTRVVMTLADGRWIRRIAIEERSGDALALDFTEPKAAGTDWIDAWQKNG